MLSIKSGLSYAIKFGRVFSSHSPSMPMPPYCVHRGEREVGQCTIRWNQLPVWQESDTHRQDVRDESTKICARLGCVEEDREDRCELWHELNHQSVLCPAQRRLDTPRPRGLRRKAGQQVAEA
jgi:hypothetical protein